MECLVSVNEKNYLPIVETFLIVEILIISAQKEITVEICTLQREKEREREILTELCDLLVGGDGGAGVGQCQPEALELVV